jgi:hypothetical protein
MVVKKGPCLTLKMALNNNKVRGPSGCCQTAPVRQGPPRHRGGSARIGFLHFLTVMMNGPLVRAGKAIRRTARLSGLPTPPAHRGNNRKNREGLVLIVAPLPAICGLPPAIGVAVREQVVAKFAKRNALPQG